MTLIPVQDAFTEPQRRISERVGRHSPLKEGVENKKCDDKNRHQRDKEKPVHNGVSKPGVHRFLEFIEDSHGSESNDGNNDLPHLEERGDDVDASPQ